MLVYQNVRIQISPLQKPLRLEATPGLQRLEHHLAFKRERWWWLHMVDPSKIMLAKNLCQVFLISYLLLLGRGWDGDKPKTPWIHFWVAVCFNINKIGFQHSKNWWTYIHSQKKKQTLADPSSKTSWVCGFGDAGSLRTTPSCSWALLDIQTWCFWSCLMDQSIDLNSEKSKTNLKINESENKTCKLKIWISNPKDLVQPFFKHHVFFRIVFLAEVCRGSDKKPQL